MAATNRPIPDMDKPNRREFLYYVGGASLALFAAGSCGALVKFLNPQPVDPDFPPIELDLNNIPKVTEWPLAFPPYRFWLVNLDNGLLALHGICTFMKGMMREGCLPKWVPYNHRFECPCCGSKYTLDGKCIEGPSKRGLDRFTLEVTTPEGRIITPSDGSPVKITDATQILVDTNRVIYGQARQG